MSLSTRPTATKQLHRLTVEVAKLEGQLDQTRHEIADLLGQTSQTQEQVDREFTVLRARQTDVEKARSDIQDTLSHVQYELANVQETVKNVQVALGHREAELQAENQALAASRSEVQTLVANTGQLMGRLTTLRNDFKTTYQANLEMLGKLGRSREVQGGVVADETSAKRRDSPSKIVSTCARERRRSRLRP